jgi:Family of unknown function (DUF6527)
MMEPISLKHEFVEFIPDDLKERTIYVSISFATATHLCCCGCGEKVVTPLRPTDWKLIFDGKTISLDPSIGNWSFACRSHYWVSNNKIRWASQWSREEIDGQRRGILAMGKPDTVRPVRNKSQRNSHNRKKGFCES